MQCKHGGAALCGSKTAHGLQQEREVSELPGVSKSAVGGTGPGALEWFGQVLAVERFCQIFAGNTESMKIPEDTKYRHAPSAGALPRPSACSTCDGGTGSNGPTDTRTSID
jgi:hypothetical protein